MADISADIRDEISDISADIVTYLDNNYYFLHERLFYFFYVHCGILMKFLYDVWIITYFFNNVLYVLTIDISTGI